MSYPLLGGHAPVLIPSPRLYVARQTIALERDILALSAAQRHRWDLAHRCPPRADDLKRQATALNANICLAERMRAIALDALHVADVVRAAVFADPDTASSRAYNLSDVLRYARRDWSGDTRSEQEVQAVLAPCTAAAMAYATRDPILILGAGAGRLADELSARGWIVSAAEASLAMTLFYVLLHRERELTFSCIHTRNRRTVRSSVDICVAQKGACLGRGPQYVLCDVRTLPWADKSFGCVVSVYFSDVLPLSTLMNTLAHALTPHGIFIHLGPLHYHHDQIEEHLAADQFLRALEEHDFTIVHWEWLTGTHLVDDGALITRVFDNLFVVARNKADVADEAK